jgi:hypothetical protein
MRISKLLKIFQNNLCVTTVGIKITNLHQLLHGYSYGLQAAEELTILYYSSTQKNCGPKIFLMAFKINPRKLNIFS